MALEGARTLSLDDILSGRATGIGPDDMCAVQLLRVDLPPELPILEFRAGLVAECPPPLRTAGQGGGRESDGEGSSAACSLRGSEGRSGGEVPPGTAVSLEDVQKLLSRGIERSDAASVSFGEWYEVRHPGPNLPSDLTSTHAALPPQGLACDVAISLT